MSLSARTTLHSGIERHKPPIISTCAAHVICLNTLYPQILHQTKLTMFINRYTKGFSNCCCREIENDPLPEPAVPGQTSVGLKKNLRGGNIAI